MFRRIRVVAGGSTLGWAALLGMTVALLGAGTAGAGAKTNASIYTPFNSLGKPAGPVTKTVQGSCFTGSIAVAHERAWRCMSGNLLYDPCFSTPNANGIVLCTATGPWSSSLIKITLTKKLPTKFANKGKPSMSGIPWALITTSGWKCGLITGATTSLGGERLNYVCKGTQDGLWGGPIRNHEPLTIYAAIPHAKKLSKTVAIKSAWF